MKKQVAQFVPYTDTLGIKVDDTTGMTPVNVGNDGKLYTEQPSEFIQLYAVETNGITSDVTAYRPVRFYKHYVDGEYRDEITVEEAYKIIRDNVGKKFYFSVYVDTLNMQSIQSNFNTIVSITDHAPLLQSVGDETTDFTYAACDGVVDLLLVNDMDGNSFYIQTVPVSILLVNTAMEYDECFSVTARGTFVGEA